VVKPLVLLKIHQIWSSKTHVVHQGEPDAVKAA